ncbi:MAG: DUF1501 domain-containing protein, partial [Planctomycetota bacterium]
MPEKFTQPLTRRSFFDFSATGLATAAFLSLTGKAASAAVRDDQPAAPHFTPRAKRAIHICLIGGYSQIDTFDYKPELFRLNGKPIPGDEKPDTFFGSSGLLTAPHWQFRQ